MTDIWCPFAKRNEAPRHLWGKEQKADTGLLHSTESPGTFSPAKDKYYGHTSYPNTTITATDIWEHIPINRSSRALLNLAGGVETNHTNLVQIEIAWRANDIRNLPQGTLENLRKYMRWVEQHTLIPRLSTVTWVPYPRSYGLNASQRLHGAAWVNYKGWLGHQHAAENSHGDPGDIDIVWLLDGNTPPPKKEETMSQAEVDTIVKHIDKRFNETKHIVEANAVGILSYLARNQKTGILYRIEGTKDPWYGLVGGKVIGPLTFEGAVEFKRQHEITENSIEIPKVFHDAYTGNTSDA